MAKKKVNVTDTIVLLGVLLGVVAFIMMFTGTIKHVTEILGKEVSVNYTGFEIAFGKKTNGTEIMKASPMAMVTIFLPLVGAIFSALSFWKKSKLFTLIAAVALVASAVLMFILPNFAELITANIGIVKVQVQLGVGAIIGGVVSALGALAVGYSLIKK